MQPVISNPSTTIRRYSLFAEAYQREQDARKEWISAGFLNEVEGTTASAVRLIQAAEKLKKAIQDRKSVVRETFGDFKLTPRERGNGITDYTFKKRGQ